MSKLASFKVTNIKFTVPEEAGTLRDLLSCDIEPYFFKPRKSEQVSAK
jgi:hypothetical protein